jgi:hypothetical protein
MERSETSSRIETLTHCDGQLATLHNTDVPFPTDFTILCLLVSRHGHGVQLFGQAWWLVKWVLEIVFMNREAI